MTAPQIMTLANAGAFQEECLNLLMGSMDASSALTYMIDERGCPVSYQTRQMHANQHRQYLHNYQQLDPLYPGNFRNENNARVVRMNDLVPYHLRSSHPYYTDFLAPWQVQDIIELFFRVDGRLVAGAAIVTNTQQPELRNTEIKRLEALHRFVEFSLEQTLQSPHQQQFDQFCTRHDLTARECMVLERVLQGLPNKVIANSLNCGLATIKTHLQHIFAKTGVNSKAEVVSLFNRGPLAH
ncbi:MAG: LuxR C-terminal-related transcriptional regulator [Marinobacterium sp.]|nr:LuxR C-terminal-related transcriptional regulator [Marinobacterium sp.]